MQSEGEERKVGREVKGRKGSMKDYECLRRG